MQRSQINALTQKIIGAGIEVHRHLGPGLLESTYESCFVYELEQLKLKVERQKSLPIIYKDVEIAQAYRIDLLIEQMVVVELKVVENILPVYEAQILSYLKLGGYPVGLLINFKVKLLKDGIKRFVM